MSHRFLVTGSGWLADGTREGLAGGLLLAALRRRRPRPAAPVLDDRAPGGHGVEGPRLSLGNVSTPTFVTPNDPARLARYQGRYGGDFDFIRATVGLHPPGARVWREEVICLVRPHPG